MLEAIRKKLDKVVCFVAGSFFTVSVLSTAIGMADRTFGLGLKAVWAEEITRFTMAWAMFIIMGLCLRTGRQAAFTLILDTVSVKKRIVMEVIINLLISLLFVIMLVYGFKMAIANMNQLSPVLQISMFYPYVSIPIGAALVLFETMTALYLRGRDWKALHIGGVN